MGGDFGLGLLHQSLLFFFGQKRGREMLRIADSGGGCGASTGPSCLLPLSVTLVG